MRHLANTDTAETELAIHGMWTTAAVAAGVSTNLELWCLLLLLDQTFFRHCSGLLKWESEKPEQSSTFFVVGRRCHDCDVHASGAINFVLINLVED